MSDDSKAMVHIPGPPPPLPWERQSVETDDAWRAFKAFRDARPPRRQRSVVGFSTNTICQWYNDFNWPGRCSAYDAHMEKIAQGERESILRQAASEVSAEHMAMIQTARHLAQLELDKLLDASNQCETNLLRPGEVIKLSEAVVKLDRLVRGESTESVEHNVDLSRLSIDELRTMRELTKKAESNK